MASNGNRLFAPPYTIDASPSILIVLIVVVTTILYIHHRHNLERHRNDRPVLPKRPRKPESGVVPPLRDEDGKHVEIGLVRGSGRRLSSASYLGREITPLRDTARTYKEPREVEKDEIKIVKGSGRTFGEESPVKETARGY